MLSTFSHKSYPQAPSLCLAKFDELSAPGLEAFVRRYDPYWDVPLVRSLPSPVNEFPKLEMKVGEEQARYMGRWICLGIRSRQICLGMWSVGSPRKGEDDNVYS